MLRRIDLPVGFGLCLMYSRPIVLLSRFNSSSLATLCQRIKPRIKTVRAHFESVRLKMVNGGDGGIRTLGTLLGYAHLANECLKPLGHISAAQSACFGLCTGHLVLTSRRWFPDYQQAALSVETSEISWRNAQGTIRLRSRLA
jgi:hypothetical protein